jgi:hypothetical protein
MRRLKYLYLHKSVWNIRKNEKSCKMYNKVFISYAREDHEYAENLYSFLQTHDYSPWMDKKELMPGQNWDYQIQTALRRADFIILLLSDNSVGKRGYVQREFNQAVIYCEEKLDSDIYIIPVKINKCEIPAKLNKFQWVEYSSNDAFNKILNAINHQRIIITKEEDKKKLKMAGFDNVDTTVRGEYGEKSPKQTYDITYFRFNDIETESLSEINTLVKGQVINQLMMSRDNYYNFLKDLHVEEEESMYTVDSSCNGTITVSLINNKFISYTSFWSIYETGAMHGYYSTTGNNYFINPLRSFELKDLFNDWQNALTVFRNCIHNKLMLKAKLEYEEDTTEYFYLYDEGLEATEENFDNFYFKEDALIFIYNPYHLTAWAFGDHHPEITFEELIKLFPEESRLIEFVYILKQNLK